MTDHERGVYPEFTDEQVAAADEALRDGSPWVVGLDRVRTMLEAARDVGRCPARFNAVRPEHRTRCVFPAGHGGGWHDDGLGSWVRDIGELEAERKATALAEAVGERFSGRR